MDELRKKLHHRIPAWVPDGAQFHIRIRLEQGTPARLTDLAIASHLLDSFVFYHQQRRWYAWLVVLMPDHLHAILSFPRDTGMSRTIGEWKKYHAKAHRLTWQDNYFDHRLRSADAFVEKAHYLRMNPVRAGLCAQPKDWPWVVEPWKLEVPP
jgi:REP element-mobilizing transposase RayT